MKKLCAAVLGVSAGLMAFAPMASATESPRPTTDASRDCDSGNEATGKASEATGNQTTLFHCADVGEVNFDSGNDSSNNSTNDSGNTADSGNTTSDESVDNSVDNSEGLDLGGLLGGR